VCGAHAAAAFLLESGAADSKAEGRFNGKEGTAADFAAGLSDIRMIEILEDHEHQAQNWREREHRIS
jgi:hypothetical protein